MAGNPSEIRKDRRLGHLAEMRAHGGDIGTPGLQDRVIQPFLDTDPSLTLAIDRAYTHYVELKTSHPDFLELDEADQVRRAQQGLSLIHI